MKSIICDITVAPIDMTKTTFTYQELFSDKAGAGFYKNTDVTYEGIVIKDNGGNLTYVDIIHHKIYPFTDAFDSSTFYRTHNVREVKLRPLCV